MIFRMLTTTPKNPVLASQPTSDSSSAILAENEAMASLRVLVYVAKADGDLAPRTPDAGRRDPEEPARRENRLRRPAALLHLAGVARVDLPVRAGNDPR